MSATNVADVVKRMRVIAAEVPSGDGAGTVGMGSRLLLTSFVLE